MAKIMMPVAVMKSSLPRAMDVKPIFQFYDLMDVEGGRFQTQDSLFMWNQSTRENISGSCDEAGY